MTAKVCLVSAVGADNAIGVDNQLPWRSPADLRRFRALTTGHAVVMGRRTFESIGRALPQRVNIVLSRRPPAGGFAGCQSADNLQAALAMARRACPHSAEVFVIGGGEVYQQALPQAQVLRLTRVLQNTPNADAKFPAVDWAEWEECEREEAPNETPPLIFVVCRRRAGGAGA